ncbi:head-tail adaptor protein [Shinella daejeonensis]|uniref:phage head completion protein n=1 Tax=Shinella daejeonensis TaxID=659017 RepID=UPI0020C7BC20|nr:head-tail adaptor protein [Shinella daejeonensis]MCP8894295.1 head-tail adaptor protein [Shinella daejeonensis]
MAGAGDLRYRVAFDRRDRVKDDAGNHQRQFVEQFQRRAAFIYAGGGEAVMAARLEGRGVLKVRVRSCSLTRTITQDWQMRDARSGEFVNDVWTGTTYAIREVDALTDRQWVYLVVERGVAS